MEHSNISADEMSARVDLLSQIADDLISSGLLPADEVILRPLRLPLVIEGYAILNGAFKRWRMPAGHRTEAPKIAALTSAAIMGIKPFRPVDYGNVTKEIQLKCNEILAIMFSSTIIGADLQFNPNRHSNTMRRLIDIITESDLLTLDVFKADIDMQINRSWSHYNPEFNQKDRLVINALITIFELIPAYHKL